MKTMALTVRDHKFQWQGHVPLDIGHAVVASLSADPPGIRSLHLALERFLTSQQTEGLFQDLKYATTRRLELSGAPQCAIDLHRRLLITSWNQVNCPATVYVPTADGSDLVRVRYDLHPDWILTSHFQSWDAANERPFSYTPEQIQGRLYGTEMLRYLLRASQPDELKAAGWTGTSLRIGHDKEVNYEVFTMYESVQRGWFRSPSGIGDLSIRGLLLRDCIHVQRDMIHRIEQWIETNECPRGMPAQGSSAPVVGPGRHEVLIYQGLLTFLTLQLFSNPLPGRGRSQKRSIRLLARARDWWLSEKSDVLGGRSPEDVIRLERKRIPIQDSHDAHVIDHDCPLCRLSAADNLGPQFWEMDDLITRVPYPRFWCGTDETFDIKPDDEDHDEWERCEESEPMSWQYYRMYHDPDESPGEMRIVTWSLPPGDPMTNFPRSDATQSSFEEAKSGETQSDRGPWRHTFVNAPPEPVPHSFRVYFLAGYLGEIIEDLKKRDVTRSDIDDLNRQFDNLIEAVRNSPSLLQPVIDRLIDLLHGLPDDDAELNAKIECLEGQLDAMAAVPAG